MKVSPVSKQDLVRELLSSGCLKFGQFTLKNGNSSTYYIDLREATLHLSLFHSIVQSIMAVIPEEKCSKSWQVSPEDRPKVAIVGVPYGVVPLASAVAYESKIIYYPVRKEVKDHGRQPDSTMCNDHEFILIEDVMSSGSSIIETIKKMEGKNITDVIVVVDRESGGAENLKTHYPNIRLHSIIKASELLKLSKDD